MNEQAIALGALVLLLSLALGALLSRWYFAPTGSNRAPRTLEEWTTLHELMRPTGVDDLGYCPAEERVTLHAYHRDTRVCWTCRCETPTAVPR